MNHKWNGNTCEHCGLKRARKTQKLRMAITSNPPYDHYQYTTKMAYSWNGERWSFTRPECYPMAARA